MNRIYSYALLKAFYDEGEDYIDAFQPLLVSTLPSDGRALHVSEIADLVQDTVSIQIPEMALQVIAGRTKRSGLAYRKDRRFGLTDAGKRERRDLNSNRDVERRLNSFVEDARAFIADRGIDLSRDEVWMALEQFVATNLEFFEQFVGAPEPEQLSPDPDVAEAALLEYCCWVEDANPSQFETLRDIVLGSVIASSVYTASFADVGRKFDRTIVYLDSNIVFNLLELHYETFTRPVLEMFRLMKRSGSFEFRVFDFTVDEVIAVLRIFGRRSRRYVPGVKVNSIISSLKSKGWSVAQVRQYIASIEEHLHTIGVLVEATDVDLREYVPPDGERTVIEGYKPGQILEGQNHDLAAIHQIRARRRHTPRQIERAETFFLSADRRLARFNFIEHRHRDRATVSEIVPASVLTTFLWLKDPSRAADIPLRSIIVMHSRELLVAREVWDRFFETVKRMRQSGALSKEDSSVLIYEPRLEEELRLTPRAEINDGWVLRGVREARGRLNREFAERTEQQIAKLSTKYSTELAEQEAAFRDESTSLLDERERQFQAALENTRARVKSDAKSATRYALALAGSVGSILILFFTIWLWSVLSLIAAAIAFALLFIGPVLALTVPMSDVRERLQNRVFNRILRRKLAASRLSELESFLSSRP